MIALVAVLLMLLSPLIVGALIARAEDAPCTHPPRALRIDGVYTPDCGLGAEAAGCITCTLCLNTWNCAVRPDFARQFGYGEPVKIDGGPRAFSMSPTIAPAVPQTRATRSA